MKPSQLPLGIRIIPNPNELTSPTPNVINPNVNPHDNFAESDDDDNGYNDYH